MNVSKIAVALALCATVTACGEGRTMLAPSGPTSDTNLRPGTQTIAALVAGNSNFEVLLAAVDRAGLVGALSGTNQLTVFAPDDAAFRSFLGVQTDAQAIAAVNGQPVEALANLLLFHVTEGRRASQSVMAAPSYKMLNGGTLTRAQLAAAGIETPDISAANGIVHVIRAVLVP